MGRFSRNMPLTLNQAGEEDLARYRIQEISCLKGLNCVKYGGETYAWYRSKIFDAGLVAFGKLSYFPATIFKTVIFII